jgi:hypothetical protein
MIQGTTHIRAVAMLLYLVLDNTDLKKFVHF